MQHAERAVAGAGHAERAWRSAARGIKPHHKPRLSHAASLVPSTHERANKPRLSHAALWHIVALQGIAYL